jgi:hypothetical protein
MIPVLRIVKSHGSFILFQGGTVFETSKKPIARRSEKWHKFVRIAMAEILYRFFVGGVVVCAFASLGDVLKPKSFAGLFGAAPSVAIATLALTLSTHGPTYAATEARSMMAGALAFLFYACVVTGVTRRFRVSVIAAAVLLIPIWFMSAFGLWTLWLKASNL